MRLTAIHNGPKRTIFANGGLRVLYFNNFNLWLILLQEGEVPFSQRMLTANNRGFRVCNSSMEGASKSSSGIV